MMSNNKISFEDSRTTRTAERANGTKISDGQCNVVSNFGPRCSCSSQYSENFKARKG